MAHALTLESGRQPGAATLALIRRLIAFDTVSERSNLALIEFVAGYLDDLGIASELVYDEGHAKANLYATLGPADRSGIALSGIPTWCRSRVSPGTATPSRCWNATVASTGGAPPT